MPIMHLVQHTACRCELQCEFPYFFSVTEQLCGCTLQSFLFQQKKAASLTSENAPLPSEAPVAPKPPAGISLSKLSQSAVAGLKEMSWTTTVLLGMTGATAGVASGLLGIGGGTVVTPLLAIMTPLSQVSKLPNAYDCVQVCKVHTVVSNSEQRLWLHLYM